MDYWVWPSICFEILKEFGGAKHSRQPSVESFGDKTSLSMIFA